MLYDNNGATATTQPGEKTLAVENISLSYTDGSRTTYALRDITVSLPPGKFYGIMGPSGSGKSSLLYILSGLKNPTAGKARFGSFVYGDSAEKSVTQLRREKFGFVFQQPFLLPYLSAIENIIVAAPKQDKETREKARDLLASLGIGDMGDKFPSQLSGGEKQRVSAVRAMINDPEVIFADEPTAALDHTNGLRVVDALASWRTRGTVVVVTHDQEMVAGADCVLLLRDGALAEIQEPGAIREAAQDRRTARATT